MFLLSWSLILTHMFCFFCFNHGINNQGSLFLLIESPLLWWELFIFITVTRINTTIGHEDDCWRSSRVAHLSEHSSIRLELELVNLLRYHVILYYGINLKPIHVTFPRHSIRHQRVPQCDVRVVPGIVNRIQSHCKRIENYCI